MTYVHRHFRDLQPSTRRAIQLLEMQLYNRFIASGPAMANMVAMCSNPIFEWPPTFLTSQQAIVAKMHHAAALTDAEAALGAIVPASPRRSSLELVPRSSESLLSYGMRSFEPEATPAVSSYSIEGHMWKHIGAEDVNLGVVQEVVGGLVKSPRFNIMVFWAAPAIQKKFPARFRVFKRVFAAINHEANVEGIFSIAGKSFSKSRTDIGSQQLCESIECTSGEKRRRTNATEIQAAYKQLKRDRLRQAASSSHSSSLSASSSLPASSLSASSS